MKVRRFFAYKTFFQAVLTLFFAAGCSGKTAVRYTPHRDAPKPPEITREEALVSLGGDFFVTEDFVSHLPLVVFDVSGGKMMVYDNSSGENSVADEPVFASAVTIPGEYNAGIPVKEYFNVTLVDGGIPWAAPVPGMESGSEWAFLGSVRDKSLMRDYLSLCLFRDIMPETPDARFCEVLLRTEKGCRYEGVYVFAETTAQGTGERFALQVGKMERALGSQRHKDFSKYSGIIRVDSFVDYFILEEFLQKESDSGVSLYLDKEGKIRPVPPLDNDSILSGGRFGSPDPRVNVMRHTPLFERLTMDMAFLNRVTARYSKLRRTTLREENIIRLLDETAEYLGPARLRDWKRWSSAYIASERETPVPLSPDPEGVVLTENPRSFEAELIKMKYLVARHGSVLGNSVRYMTWQEDLFDSSYNTGWSILFIGLYVFVYLLSVHFGRHH